MKVPLFVVLLSSLFALATASYAQPPMGGPMMGRGMMGNVSPRHPYVMRYGLPAAYSSLRNPLPATTANIDAGKALYSTRCSACHGDNGRGDGPAAASLNPPPSDLTFAVHTRVATDGYLYWTLAEGGVPVGSAMPPFKDSLTADEAWKIILFLRHL